MNTTPIPSPKAQQLAASKSVANKLGVKVGDVFTCSWGYDQTNVDFYRVIKTTASGVWVQQWQAAHVDTEGPHDRLTVGGAPKTEVDWSEVDQDADYWDQQEQKKLREVEPEFHKTVAGYQGRVAFTVNSFSVATLWDGAPEYQTGAGYGH